MSDIDALREAILSLDGAVFAVLDGAQFKNLPETLLRLGLEASCLYLDRGDNHPERLITAPYMVGPLDDAGVEKVLSVLSQTSAVVFWECQAGAERLYSHLRGINMVQIPTASNGGAEPTTFEPMLLRHADANVMAQILPALDQPKLSRLLGPATAVCLLPRPDWCENADRPAVRLLRRQEDWPKASRAMLRIDLQSISTMNDTRARALRSKRIRILRRSSPSLFDDLTDDEVAHWAQDHERSGRAIGLKTERGLLQWTYLMGGSKGRFADSPDIRRHLTTGFGTPDRKLDAMMGAMVDASKDDRR